MISAWKRFINNTGDANGTSVFNSHGSSPGQNGTTPPGIQKLDKELQRKFARGINYNMKVVIKGDSQVGKSCLFLRLKGYGFQENYTPTETLNVTSINWNYKATDDVVKIDLWEAIDSTSANKKTNLNYVDLKLENKIQDQSSTSPQQPQPTKFSNLDELSNNTMTTTTTTTSSFPDKPTIISNGNNNNNITITNTKLSLNNNGSANNEFKIPESAKQSLAMLSEHLDVYKGTDAVLLVMDMTKSWTFKYIQSELPKIPKHIPILIVANHRDQGHHRTISSQQVKSFIEGLDRYPGDGVVMYTEASMKNGFGLKLIQKFFNIPFLKLQEASLLKQLELNRCDFMSTNEELHVMLDSLDREYEQYIELETIKRRQQADAMSPVNSGLKQLDESTREQIRNATISSETIIDSSNQANRIIKSIGSKNNDNNQPSTAKMMAEQNFVNHRLPSIIMGAKCPLPEIKNLHMNRSGKELAQSTKANTTTSNSNNLDKNSSNKSTEGEINNDDDDDSDDEEEIPRANPLVANYQSDLDSDDQVSPASTLTRENENKDKKS